MHKRSANITGENTGTLQVPNGVLANQTEPSKFDLLMSLLEGITYEDAQNMLNLALSQIGNAAIIQKY